MSRLEENFTKFRYEDWLPLSNEDIYQLNEKDFQVINVLQEKFKEDLVDKSYLSMVDLLSINIRNYNRINRKIKDTETSEQKKYPFIIGVAGSVASGKSTFSRILELLLKKSLKGFIRTPGPRGGQPGPYKGLIRALKGLYKGLL